MADLVPLKEVIATANTYADRYYRLHVPLHSIDFSAYRDVLRLYGEHATQRGPLYDLLIVVEGIDTWRELWIWPGRDLLMVRTSDITGIRVWNTVPDVPANPSVFMAQVEIFEETHFLQLPAMLNGAIVRPPDELIGRIDLNRILLLQRDSSHHWTAFELDSLVGWAKRILEGPEPYLIQDQDVLTSAAAVTTHRHLPEHLMVVPASEVGSEYSNYQLAVSWTSFAESGDGDVPEVHHLLLDSADVQLLVAALSRPLESLESPPK